MLKILFRENVSYQNPEGTLWKSIEIPDGIEALSVSCTEDGVLWVVTCQHSVLKRTGVTGAMPWGSEWIKFDFPLQVNLIQITANMQLVYVLASNGCAYLLNFENSEWLKVLKDLTSISVSTSNKVVF